MITATPRLATAQPGALFPPAPGTSSVRPARSDDATALAALSRPFVRSGALRERPRAQYVTEAPDFLVVEAPDGTLEGCVGLSVHRADPGAGRPAAGVLYNFCVAGHRQGSGLGARLLLAALARARSRSLQTLFAATTGGGRLFLRHGFAPVCPDQAPPAWAQSLDPRREARVLARAV
ncbi:GNAT family N-acetyltransferase [Streptomyces sp. NPDC058985]|uniref:GNAT family N-acetyltransferase n=1 Tax=Streptomyces sp. NPDC058985 TaxID=3346684 RepID=UPI0036B926E7